MESIADPSTAINEGFWQAKLLGSLPNGVLCHLKTSVVSAKLIISNLSIL